MGKDQPASACPAGIAALPLCPVRGLPVPYSSGRDPDGAGRFGLNDPVAKLECGVRRLCGVCGQPLGDEIVFLAAVPAGQVLTRPVFPDPAMSEACADAAMTLCPRIARGRDGAPGWLMWVTGTYELVPGRRSAADFLPGPAIRIRRFEYSGGRLAEVTR